MDIETPILRGDGIHDDAPALQAMLDAQPFTDARGPEPHTYRIGTTLLVRRGISNVKFIMRDGVSTNAPTIRIKRRAVTKPYGPPTRRKWT